MADPIRLITLDLDDTLWPCFPTIRAAEQRLYDWLTEQAPRLTAEHDIASLREHRLALARRQPEIAHNLTEVRLRSLRGLARDYHLPDTLAEQANELFRAERNRVSAYPEVRDVLLRLRSSYLLVALTNGNAQVEQTPLAGCFHYSFTAEQVGAAKPDPALFEAASRASGVALTQALHVGDDPLRDIAPARSLGMRTAWVNRADGAWPADLARPDMIVQDMEQLWERLKAEV